METGPYLKAWTPISPVVTDLWLKYASNDQKDTRLTKIVKAITNIRLERTGRGDSPEVIEQAIDKFLKKNKYQGKAGLEKAITSRLENTIGKQMEEVQREADYRMARRPDPQFRGSDNRTAEQMVQGTEGFSTGKIGGINPRIKQFARQFAQGLPFVGTFADEAEAFLLAMSTPEERSLDAYQDRLNAINQEQANYRQFNPAAANFAELSGSVLGSYPLGRPISAVTNRGPLALQEGQGVRNFARRMGQGGIVGAAEGAATQAGIDADPNKVFASSLFGGATGAVGEGMIGAGTDAASRLGGLIRANNGGNGNMINPPGLGSSPNEPANRATAKLLLAAERDEGLKGIAAINAGRQRLEDQAALPREVNADQTMFPDLYGRNVMNVADTLVNRPGEGNQQLAELLQARQRDQKERVPAALQRFLGEGETPQMAKERLDQERYTNINPEYKNIEGQVMTDPTYGTVIRRDDRMSPNYELLREDYKRRGLPSYGPIADAENNPLGPYTLRQIEDVRQSTRDALDKFPSEPGYIGGRAAQSLEQNLNEIMGAARAENQTYARLLDEGMDNKQMIDHVKYGYEKAASENPKDLEEYITKKVRSENQMDALRKGFVEKLTTRMGEKTAEMGDRASDWNSENMKKRIRLMFGNEDNFNIYKQMMDVERRRSGTYNYTMGNSATARRLAAQEEQGGIDPLDVLGLAASYNSPQAFLGITRRNVPDFLNVNRLENLRMSEQMLPMMKATGFDENQAVLQRLQDFIPIREQYMRDRAARDLRGGLMSSAGGYGLANELGLLD